MERVEDDVRAGIPWRTLPPRSGMFFVAILLAPFALAVLVQVVFHPEMLWKGEYLKWVWFALLGGFGSLFECIRQWNVRYFTTIDAIERSGLFGRTRLTWGDIEAVGTEKIFRESRYSPGQVEGIVVHLYGRQRTFSPRLSVDDADSLIYVAMKHSPEILRIDETDGTFELPREGDSERLRTIVARHARRLRRRHAMALTLCGLVLVPGTIYVGNDIRTGRFSGDDVKTMLFSFWIFTMLSWRHWGALWRLRR